MRRSLVSCRWELRVDLVIIEMKCDILTGLVLIKMKWLAEQFSRSLLLLALLGNITDDLTGLKHFETGPISFQQSLKYKSNDIICTSRNIQNTWAVGGYIIIYCSRAKIWLYSKSCYSDNILTPSEEVFFSSVAVAWTAGWKTLQSAVFFLCRYLASQHFPLFLYTKRIHGRWNLLVGLHSKQLFECISCIIKQKSAASFRSIASFIMKNYYGCHHCTQDYLNNSP